MLYFTKESKILFKVATVTLYPERPMHLVYHHKEFHVLDIKVMRLYGSILFERIIFFSPTSVQFSLEQLMIYSLYHQSIKYLKMRKCLCPNPVLNLKKIAM